MALSKLTKVQTLGIGSNIEVVGVITTGQFKSGTSNLHSSGVELTNLNVSGIATIGGNVSIGGTLTYQDVTNIDSVGIVTARQGIHIDDSIVHIGDTNTKIRFPANDEISLETSGHDRIYIKSNGSVGIGTDTPIGGLHLNSNGNNGISFRMENYEGYSSFHNDGGALHLDSGQHIFRNQAGSTEFARITSSGSVGINSTSPSRKLVVVDNLGGGIGVIGGNAGIYMGEHHTGGFINNCAIARAAAVNYHITGSAVGDLCIAGEESQNILFGTSAHAGAMAERLRIASDGVATFSATNINVNRNAGDAYIALQTSGSDNVALYGGASSGFRVFTKPSGGSLTERLRIESTGSSIFDVGAPNSSNKVIGRFQAQSSRKLDIVWHDSGSLMGFDTPGNHSYIFKVGGNERLRIDSNGYVTKPNMPIASLSDSGATNVSNAILTSSNFYNHTWVNQGSHFNASTGRFTCPVAGVYRIYFRATTDQTEHTNVRLRKNGSTINEAYANGTNGTTHSDSSEAIVNCSANDYLEIQVSRLKASGGTQHKQVTFQLLH